MNIKNKKFLITGGAGFIGSHMTDRLLSLGAKVIIIDNLITGRKENLNPRAKFYEKNINDLQIEKIFQKERPDFIYHLAFNVLVPKSIQNPLIDMDSISGSVNILINAQKYGIKKIIFSSSGFIYGNTRNLPAKEEEPIQPTSSYAIAKYTIENYLKFFKKTFNLSYVIFRYPAVYGPRQVTGAMADYIKKLSLGKQAEIYGNGEKTRDYIYVDDIIQANLLALDLTNDFENPIFNIGTGKETTLNEIYQKIANLLGRKAKPIYLPDRPGEQVRYCLDAEKAQKTLLWKPKYTLEEGLKLRVKSYVDNLY